MFTKSVATKALLLKLKNEQYYLVTLSYGDSEFSLNIAKIQLVHNFDNFLQSHQCEGNIQGLPISSLSPRVLSARAATTCKNIYGPICGDCNTLWVNVVRKVSETF